MTTETDALIIGAGPCGLFQVFELGLLGIKADLVDSLPEVGGQCTWLYPEKPIYDIPAVPVCTGAELVANLMRQIEPFAPRLHLGDEVRELSGSAGQFDVVTASGRHFRAKTVFIAGGVGSFQPRRLMLEHADALEDQALHYRVTDPARFDGQCIVILGGGDSALDWVLALKDRAASLTLVHRRDDYRAAPATVAAVREAAASGQLRLIESATATALAVSDGHLAGIEVTPAGGPPELLPASHVLAFFGLSPKLGPIADWGLAINKKALTVDTERFETSTPGIFAIGDICDYPGKKKLILSGFHEAALAAFAAKAIIEPGKKVHLQYTTTSPVMHKRLGVAG